LDRGCGRRGSKYEIVNVEVLVEKMKGGGVRNNLM